MQTQISDLYKNQDLGNRANDILRSCVHCGFCNATCPTYQMMGNELDGPRGRIYLIKQLLEGKESGEKTKLHLDRCLNCLNCETTCPSGVQYHELLEIGQKLLNDNKNRTWSKSLLRYSILKVMPYQKRFSSLIALGQFFSPVLPKHLAKMLPHKVQIKNKSVAHSNNRKMILLSGCVQQGIRESIHNQTIHVFNQLKIETLVLNKSGCCGALPHHLQSSKQTKNFIIQNIDAWWPSIEKGCEAIISNASGCSVMLKDYARVLGLCDNVSPQYIEKAQKISSLAKDISEVIEQENLSNLSITKKYQSLSYHPPCTLQHGQKLPGIVEKVLLDKGLMLNKVENSHLCCGSAGSYSLFNPKISKQLGKNKLSALNKQEPDIIVTANIGCLHHLQSLSDKPVIHWIELFE